MAGNIAELTAAYRAAYKVFEPVQNALNNELLRVQGKMKSFTREVSVSPDWAYLEFAQCGYGFTILFVEENEIEVNCETDIGSMVVTLDMSVLTDVDAYLEAQKQLILTERAQYKADDIARRRQRLVDELTRLDAETERR